MNTLPAWAACVLALLPTGTVLAQSTAAPGTPILDYIKSTWTVLMRSNRDLAKAAPDPKFHPNPDGRWPLYVPANSDLQLIEEGLRREMPASGFKTIAISALPENLDALPNQGLLYLPAPYVVPGGRFNEMYGWDSFFIQVGLLRDGETDLAKDMAENFLYQVKNYGKVLNANRTYYLDRSQPPFLSEMVLNIYAKTHDRQWLEQDLPLVEKYYDFWTSGDHLTPDTGLSRYYSSGEGPSPEVLSSERNAEGKTHYDLVKDYFRTHQVPDYDVAQYYDRETNQLTQLFYKGDRSMRESGFDPSNRFGPFNIDIIHYDPVCLNSLLYLNEMQMAEMNETLGRAADSAKWKARAEKRAAAINRLMWNDKAGLYADYDFVHRHTRMYPFLTAFYPLWAGFATKEQAERVEKNLPLFERPGGLQTSTNVSGNQWDAPFGWAPLQLIAADGLRRYGYTADAERISMEFLSLVLREYRRQGFIVEKYDVVHGGSNVSGQIKFGYSANQAGFGWTNATFTRLFDELGIEDKKKLLAQEAPGR